MKRVVDLFAGCGGLSLGFQNAGFNIVAAFEFWDIAANCYAKNFEHPVYRDDLSDVDFAVEKIRVLNPDIIIGGPPCQDFSHAGKRIEDKRAELTESFAKIVTAISPQYFVMENVDRVQKSLKYGIARSIFTNAGYGLTEIIIDASHCGVPQKRKRFFCIGSKNVEDGYLLEYIKNNLSKNEMSLSDYFGTSLNFEYYYRHPRNYSRRAIYNIDEPSPTIRGVNRPIPPGYLGHPNDAKKMDGSVRALTTLERALIQTFPPDYKWCGNKTEIEQMIGNAVPVKLAEFVAKALVHHTENNLSGEANIDFNAFHKWIQHTQSMSERTQRDILSRLKRANTICTIPLVPDDYYIFTLEQSEKYKELTPTVRSQLKRAVSLYSNYRNE